MLRLLSHVSSFLLPREYFLKHFEIRIQDNKTPDTLFPTKSFSSSSHRRVEGLVDSRYLSQMKSS